MNFSFKYDNFREYGNHVLPDGNLPGRSQGGLRVVRKKIQYDRAAYFSTEYRNVSSEKSGLIGEVYDIDQTFTIGGRGLPMGFSGTDDASAVRLVSYKGSDNTANEFCPETRALTEGRPVRLSCLHGRSSQGTLPFFELQHGQNGVLIAIGWSGQWCATVEIREGVLHVTAGIESLSFRLDPGECVKTASVLVLQYDGGSTEAHNRFKRILAERTPQNIRKGLPFFCSFWGGSSSDFILRQIEHMKTGGLPYEGVWIDAGWYGDYTKPCPTEFDPGWGDQTGNWFVNKNVHPAGLTDVAEAAKKAGYKLSLWFEPERASVNSRLYLEHPEWFITHPDIQPVALLNLGLEDVRKYLVQLIGGFVERLGLNVYRQDFNINPLMFWQYADSPDRKGITETAYINGMYAFWDELLEKYPDLIIDNCASGGRRLDIETLARSVPLWRSDYQCKFDFDPEVSQTHTAGLSGWLPYSGTGTGFDACDVYRFRSAYSAALCSNFLGYETYFKPLTAEQTKQFGKLLQEYRSLREFFACDHYPVFGISCGDTCFGGGQYDRTERGDGILLVFRRKNCPSASAEISLQGLTDGEYTVTDLNTGKAVKLSSEQLKTFTVTLPQKRSSVIYRYEKCD